MSAIASAQLGLDIGIADPPHRFQDAARMVDDFGGGSALGAEVLPAVGVLPVGGDLGDPVVRTVTSTPHEARQYRQNVCTVLVITSRLRFLTKIGPNPALLTLPWAGLLM